jgi:hypothetical protein
LKFLKKIKRTRIAAAVACLLFAVIGSYLIYTGEYEFTGDKGVLSTAITEYVHSSPHPLDAYVLEIKEIDGVLIAFFKDSADGCLWLCTFIERCESEIQIGKCKL